MAETAPDKHVEAVRQKLLSRSKVGVAKYGCTLERPDLTPLQWFQHLQDELLDAAVYTERVMADLKTAAVKEP
jgi:hypothetical protein